MQTYLGTKTIKATPMTRGEYNDYRGWDLPTDEAHLEDEEGMLVEYLDGGKSNHKNHEGYISWSPLDVFNKAYKTSGCFSFGHALELIKQGKKVARTGWNGAGMFVFLVPGSEFTVNRAPLLGIYPEGTEIQYRPHLDLRTADGSIATWSPSGSDVLAEDWILVEE